MNENLTGGDKDVKKNRSTTTLGDVRVLPSEKFGDLEMNKSG